MDDPNRRIHFRECLSVVTGDGLLVRGVETDRVCDGVERFNLRRSIPMRLIQIQGDENVEAFDMES